MIGRDDPAVSCAPGCASADGGCVVDYCASLPALAAAPTLDGVLECGLALAVIDPGGFHGNLPKPPELSVAYAAAWRPEGIYIFADVHEAQRLPAPASASVYCGDAVHAFIDDNGAYAASPAYDTPGTRQMVAAAPATATESVARGERYATNQPILPWSSDHFRTFPTATGYVFEALVTAEDLGQSPSERFALGSHVGFDLSISYGGLPSLYGDAACPKRADFILRTSAATATTAGFPHDDTRAFCSPQLSASR